MAYPLTDWNTGLFDCCEDTSTCCYGFLCCPCLACTVSGRFGENRCLPLCDMLTPAITAACGLPLCVPPAALALRVGIRHRYGIKGSLCNDIASSCFCEWCSWCQMHRELKFRKKNNVVIVNMQPPPVMSVPAGFMVQPGVRY
ncbi:cornifelin homolog B-like [Gymnodraco acuticeps]|uniref:Cornifelin homolog B-like n=1 Tax=Gymnodraco acuticeps TaxID=8218 RepID=A0A6P8UJM5_GYMAC|nr:cornifelin homolog B-like [Gymnodraco acuticeps]